jgi:hypothetical protein
VAIVRRMLPSRTYRCCHLWKTRINPDRWLEAIHGRAFARKVGTDGVVDVDDEHYYIQQALAGQQVVLFVNAPDRTFGVWLEGRVIKSLPRKRPLWSGNALGGVCSTDQGTSTLSRTARAFQTAQDAPALLWYLNPPSGATLGQSPGFSPAGQRLTSPVINDTLNCCACIPVSRCIMARRWQGPSRLACSVGMRLPCLH